MKQKIRKIKPKIKPDGMEGDIYCHLIITVVTNGKTSESIMSFHKGVEWEIALMYVDEAAQDDFRFLAAKFKDVDDLKYYSVIIPLSEKDTDEYVETGSFTSERIRDKIEAIREYDTSGRLDCLPEIRNGSVDLYSPGNTLLN